MSAIENYDVMKCTNSVIGMNGVLEIRFDIYDYVINLSPIAFNFCFKLMFLSMSNMYVSIGFKK